ncbi:MAG: hypothetical protein J6C26_09990 [Clostridia bacterium]|nr:hypothetical protein [Clostridia bacterium]
MKKSFFALLLVAALLLILAACTVEPTEESNPPEEPYDPAPFLSLASPADGDSQGQIKCVLNNASTLDVSVGGIFVITAKGSTAGTGQLAKKTVAKNSRAELVLDISHLTLADGEYTFTVTASWTNSNGTVSSKDLSVNHTLARGSVDPDPDLTDRDVKTTPIADLTPTEQETLAQYLFEHYVPYCYGVFDSTADLSSASLWASIYALNGAVDGDASAATLTREDAMKKAARYYPGATFVPEDIRMFNKETQTFMPAPAQDQKYKLLSFEVKEDLIVIYYEDIPEDTDQAPGQYATTLKNSAESGYFSFVSTLRVGAVG